MTESWTLGVSGLGCRQAGKIEQPDKGKEDKRRRISLFSAFGALGLGFRVLGLFQLPFRDLGSCISSSSGPKRQGGTEG